MGPHTLDCLKDEIKSFGKQGAVVTGRGSMRKAGVLDKLNNIFNVAGVGISVFEGIEPEPSWDSVESCVDFCKKENCDFIVGLGGGSVVDAAKAVAGLSNKDNVLDYKNGKTLDYPGLPFIAIPTTSGTGAEVTPNAVLTNKKKRQKKSFRSSLLFSKLTVLDPVLTLSCLPAVTAYSGVDALCQAVEAFISQGANPLTDSLCMKAIQLISDNLLQAYNDGNDLKAREALAYGSLLAGLALANARLGVVHGIAHPLGARYGLAHGLVVGLLFPYCLEFNLDLEERKQKYEYLASVWGKSSISEITGFLKELLDKLDFPGSLQGLGVSEADFSLIAAESMPSGSLKANPKKVSEQDVVSILKKAYI